MLIQGWQNENQTLRESMFLAPRTLKPPPTLFHCQFFTRADLVQIHLTKHSSCAMTDGNATLFF